MKKIQYHKLIRDKIPNIIIKKGGVCRIRKLDAKDFEHELLKKVGEEASGLLSAKNTAELISELADVLAVVDEIKRFKKITPAALRRAQLDNMKRKGGFTKRLYLVWAADDGYKTNERRYKK